MLTTHTGHYMPLTWLSLGLDYVLWGMNPLGYHLTSLLLHSLNAAIWFLTLLEILKHARPGEGTRARCGMALIGALFFSIHPLRVESVAWITERRDVLSGTFFLLSVFAYLRSTRAPARGRWLGLSAAAFAGSMLCKAMGMTLPLVLLLLDFWPLRRFARESWKSVLLEKLPFIGIMVVAAGLSAWAQMTAHAITPTEAYPWSERLGQPGYRLSFYVLRTLLPIGLSPLYFYRPSFGVGEVVGWIAVLMVTLFLLIRWRRFPEASIAWVSYLVLIAPVCGIIQAGPHAVADRYSYLACLPFAALASGALAFATGAAARRATAAAAILVLVGLAALTIRQCGYWKDSIALWDRALAIEPDVYFSLQNRGSARMERLDWEGALSDFNRAIELHPSYAPSWYGRGVTRAGLGDHPGAVSDLTQALALAPGKADALSARGLSRARLGDRAGALQDADAAVVRAPDTFQPNLHRGLIRMTFGDATGAVDDLSRALQIRPDSAPALFNRGLANFRSGRISDAVEDFRRTLEKNPDHAEALAQRGTIRIMMGDLQGGAGDLTESLKRKPDAPTFAQRASVRVRLRDLPGARDDYGEALRLQAGSPEYHLYRGAVQMELGDRRAAESDCRAALDLAPGSWPLRRQAEALLQRAAGR
jgi:tetratricopeptide (TPR) repeat protein